MGFGAGLAGTTVMTLSQRAEMALSGRAPSRIPAKAIEKIGDVQLADRADESWASVPVHFAYGSALGIGLAALDRVREPWRSAAFFAAAWGAGVALTTGLGLARPPHRQSGRMLAIDLGHHAIYAAAAGFAYAAANRLAEKRGLGRLKAAKRG